MTFSDKVQRHLETMIARYPELSSLRGPIAQAAQMICACHRAGGKILICGNGGSAADSAHIAGELVKGFVLTRPAPASDRERLRRAGCGDEIVHMLQQGVAAFALTENPALCTAIQNDLGASLVFAQQAYACGRPGDILLALSTSGGSMNCVSALKVARAVGMRTIGLTGNRPGGMDDQCDVLIKAPAAETYQVQELHLPIYHVICLMVEEALFGTPS